MNELRTKNTHKTHISYICVACDFNTGNKKDYNRHLSTAKHIKLKYLNNFEQISPIKPPPITCEYCQKEYVSRSGLWYHLKHCNALLDKDCDTIASVNPKSDEMIALMIEYMRDKSQDKSELIIELVKQNTEFKELLIEQNKQMVEQSKQMMELAKNSGNNNNNTTNSHNKFNLNVFLNETCKDAITLNDFINSIEVTQEDFLHTGNTGFVNGISEVLAKRIKNMDLHTRPFHCTDLKRETIYIKQDDKWEKEDSEKTHLRRAVRITANRNMNEFKRWCKDNHPSVETHGTDEYEDYFKYYKAALGGCGKEEDIRFEDKIIKNVLKEAVLDKSVVSQL